MIVSFGFDRSFGYTIKTARERRGYRNRARKLFGPRPVVISDLCQVIIGCQDDPGWRGRVWRLRHLGREGLLSSPLAHSSAASLGKAFSKKLQQGPVAKDSARSGQA